MYFKCLNMQEIECQLFELFECLKQKFQISDNAALWILDIDTIPLYVALLHVLERVLPVDFLRYYPLVHLRLNSLKI